MCLVDNPILLDLRYYSRMMLIYLLKLKAWAPRKFISWDIIWWKKNQACMWYVLEWIERERLYLRNMSRSIRKKFEAINAIISSKRKWAMELDHSQDDLVYAQRNGITWFPPENRGESTQRNESKESILGIILSHKN